MTLRTQLISLAVAFCAVTACATRPGAIPAALAPRTAGAAAAFDAGDSAQFVFPPVAPRPYLPTPEAGAQGYPGQSFIWSVTWDVGNRLGTIPHGVELRSELPEVVPEQDSLPAIVAHGRPSHEVFCLACTTPASRLVPEPALTAAVHSGQVVLTVRGRDALRRLWPAGPPDTVALFWRGPGMQRDAVKVPLVRIR